MSEKDCEDLVKQAFDPHIWDYVVATFQSVENGKYAVAVSCVEKIVALGQADFLVYYLYAIIALRLNSYSCALSFLEYALELNPDFYEGSELLAGVYAQLGHVASGAFWAKLATTLQKIEAPCVLYPEGLPQFNDLFYNFHGHPLESLIRKAFALGDFYQVNRYVIDYLNSAINIQRNILELGIQSLRYSLMFVDALYLNQRIMEGFGDRCVDFSVIVGLFLWGEKDVGQGMLSFFITGSDDYIASVLSKALVLNDKALWHKVGEKNSLQKKEIFLPRATTEKGKIGLLSRYTHYLGGHQFLISFLSHFRLLGCTLRLYSYTPFSNLSTRLWGCWVDEIIDLNGVDPRTAAEIIYRDGVSLLFDLDAVLGQPFVEILSYRPAVYQLSLGCSIASLDCYDASVVDIWSNSDGHYVSEIPLWMPSQALVASYKNRKRDRVFDQNSVFVLGVLASADGITEEFLQLLRDLLLATSSLQILVYMPWVSYGAEYCSRKFEGFPEERLYFFDQHGSFDSTVSIYLESCHAVLDCGSLRSIIAVAECLDQKVCIFSFVDDRSIFVRCRGASLLDSLGLERWIIASAAELVSRLQKAEHSVADFVEQESAYLSQVLDEFLKNSDSRGQEYHRLARSVLSSCTQHGLLESPDLGMVRGMLS